MRFRRFWTLGGSAAAAVVALAVFFATPTRHATVEAATILRNFREALHYGFRASFERIVVDGIHVDGFANVRFADGVNIATLMDEGGAGTNIRPNALYAEIAVVADENAEDVGGLDLRMNAAFTGDQKWAYVKVAHPPTQLVAEEPMVGMVLGLMRNGLMLDLSSLSDDEIFGDMDVGGSTEPAQSSTPGVHTRQSITVQAGTSDETPAGSGDDSTHAESRVNVGITVHAGDDGTGGADEPANDNSQDSALEQLVYNILRGEAGREQLEALTAALEQSAGNVNLVQHDDGLYVLTLSNLNLGQDEDIDLSQAVISIGYREQSGVESLSIEHIGANDGVVRLEFADAPIDPALLDRNRLIEPGVTMVLDVGGLASMFGGMGHP